jgi:uncharacterized membrane protein
VIRGHEKTREILTKYGVRFVIVGVLERGSTGLQEEKFKSFGRRYLPGGPIYRVH